VRRALLQPARRTRTPNLLIRHRSDALTLSRSRFSGFAEDPVQDPTCAVRKGGFGKELFVYRQGSFFITNAETLEKKTDVDLIAAASACSNQTDEPVPGH
jgi:hypothetical protein